MNSKPVTEERQIAGIFRQFIILFWKNGKLFRRNVWGTLAEILMAFIFILMILFLRYFVDLTVFNDQTSLTNPPMGVFDRANSSNRSYIYFYPNNPFIESIVTNAYNLIQNRTSNFTATLVGSNVSDASGLNASTIGQLIAFISFDSAYTAVGSIPANIKYTIYTQEQSTFQYNIATLFNSLSDYLYSYAPEYYCWQQKYFYLYRIIFNPIKHAIDLSLISAISGTTLNDSRQVKLAQLNCPGYNNDIFKTRFSFFLSILIQFSFIFTLVVNLGYIVVEKQSKMKEYLKLLGIKWYIIWLTWFLRVLIPYIILSFLISIFGIISLKPRVKDDATLGNKAVFQYTSFITAFSIMFVYSIQVSMFIIMLGQIFSRPFVAKIISILLWIITALNLFNNVSVGGMYFLTLFPNVALQYAIQIIFQYERSSKSLSYNNMYSNLYNFGLNIGGILALQLVWTLIYIPITWYIERIFPGEYGAPQPFYFPFMPSYWSSKKKDMVDDLKMKSKEIDKFGFEQDPNLNAAISIQNITKKFRTGFKEKTVVDDMSINFYENQITGLLGHNGAGKTTTTFMLCGIYAPDSGNAYILGNSILTQMDKIQSSLGFCPQYDILYDDLTVAEHIDLVASIKGYSSKEIKNEIIEITKLVGLDKDLEKKSKQLSGGMKRRLSVAMAVTGGSKVIILDEPTSGLDPFNRRGLWELIRKFKNGRSIVLTTHFMEEADALSDRIAIMNHGQVKCCGSPIFLKNTFGSGYRLILAKNKAFKEGEFKSLLSSVVPKYVVETNIAAEMTISIPFDSNSSLPTLFSKIDENKEKIGIDGYGISSPTIEEVFIKVGSIDLNIKEHEPEEKLDNENLSNAFGAEFTRNTGFVLILEQLKSLITKRFQIFIRRFILGAFILLLPFVAEGALSGIIPGQTTLINSLRGIVNVMGTQDFLKTATNYGKQTVPYYLNGSVPTTSVSNILTATYTDANKPGLTLSAMSSPVIGDLVLDIRKSNLTAFIYDYFMGMQFYLVNSSYLQVNGYFSTLAYHSSAVVLNEIDNVLLKYYTNDNTKSLTTINSPLSSDSSLSNQTSFLDVLACIDSFPVSLIDFINSIIVAFIISILVMHMGRERLNGSKQLQLLSGTHFGTYWLSNYLFDLVICLINVSSMVFIIKMVDLSKNDPTSELNAIASPTSLGYYYLMLLFSMFAWCSLAYFWSFFFRSDIIAFVVLFIILSVFAFLDAILIFVQLLFQTGVKEGEQSPGATFMNVLRNIIAFVFPNLSVKRALYDLKIRDNSFCVTQVNKYLNLNFVYGQSPVAVTEPGIGLWLIFSVLQFLLYNLFILYMETKPFADFEFKSLFVKKKAKIEQDEFTNIEADVKEEALRIKNSDLKIQSASEPLIVSQLMKIFLKGKTEFKAVNNLSFGISPRECFGLLGLNGAGKTTTFKILTGEINATSGKAYINGYDITKERSKARRNLGFCPQFDYLPEYLNVEETFRLFAGLRGLEMRVIEPTVKDLIKIFNLNEFNNKLVQKLSGGNKRKVSAAIAFIGRPSVVILDEPTTGMDPAARRYLWTVIKKAVDLGMTVVLTTHSMEESEALSSRLGIMVNGQFKCLGSVQHLKNKYGKGYSLILKCKISDNNDEQIAKVEDFVKNNIKYSAIKDKQQETLFYQIENTNSESGNADLQTIAQLFTLIEANKEILNLETYSLSQTSLEQVFLSFASEQKMEENTKK